MSRYLTEFIGTFFLVFTIGCTVMGGGPGVIPPLAVGAALMAMVFAGAHVSGAHYNPAVTLALFLRRRCPAGDVLPYWAAQIAGASLAAWTVMCVLGVSARVFPPGSAPHEPIGQVLLAEFLFTFALAYVVLNVATAKGTAGNMFYGLAIGMTVTAGAFAVGPISGGVFNPAVAVGISILGLSPWSNLWIYLVATFSGAAVAALVFKVICHDDR